MTIHDITPPIVPGDCSPFRIAPLATTTATVPLSLVGSLCRTAFR